MLNKTNIQPNEVILYVYQELSPEREAVVAQAIFSNSELTDYFFEVLTQKQELEDFFEDVNQGLVQKIMNKANDLQIHQVHSK